MSLFNPIGSYARPPAWRECICGLYYNVQYKGYLQKTYLPQVELQAHATILATTSRTVLTQTFVNPSTEKGIKEVRYTFPLYDGVSVVGFTCHIGDRMIVGEVKEKEKARAVFQEAVARGETAGLLEQLPDAADVFTTTVGNIAPGARVIIKITYLGELKHDMEVDGTRFTIPNIICPRYGNYPGTLWTTPAIDAVGSSISITVDADMADGSFIQKIQSPTHPIAMTMGTTSFAPNAEPTMSKASATLTLGSAQLDTDFVVQIIAKNTGVPKAVLENHPTIPNHRALMATLVPKFALPAEKPEIVFVCDRSGSMAGSRMTLVIQALKVFLKSLPVGVKFNICSFGSRHSFLWKKSVTYSQQTLDEAIRHAEKFSANFGGTEMLYPLKATIEQRYKDMPLEVMLLTDGEIWNQQELFSYLNQSVTESKAPIRVFTLGIGSGVSHALIEGVAKAGNGFSQTVGEGEKMDTKVVRMLKGALSPHVNDYTLEVKYSNNATPEDDDFEIVEKVADSMKVKLDLGEKKEEEKKVVGCHSKTMRAVFADYNQKKPISLFDTSADPDKDDPPAYDESGEDRYAHLPKILVPKIIQAPQNIPSLFAFNRTTVYLLLGPDAPSATPKSVVLRGTSAHGPLELEIPIQILDLPGETIHQLAAKKAISELEQGRGWLLEAKTESGDLIKTKFEGRFDDMMEREAVRLGVHFQVGGKWCSFVAVESNRKNLEEKEKETQGWEWLEDESTDTHTAQKPASSRYTFSESSDNPSDSDEEDMIDYSDEEMDHNHSRFASATERLRRLAKDVGQELGAQSTKISRIQSKSANIDTPTDEGSAQTSIRPPGMPPQLYSQMSHKKAKKRSIPDGGHGGSRGDVRGGGSVGGMFGGFGARGGSFASSQPSGFAAPSRQAPASSPFGSSSSTVFGSSTNQTQPAVSPAFAHLTPRGGASQPSQLGNHALQDYQMQFMLLEQQNKKRLLMARQEQDSAQQQQQSMQQRQQSMQQRQQSMQQRQQSMQQQQQSMQQQQQQQHGVAPPPPRAQVFGTSSVFGGVTPAAAPSSLFGVPAAPTTPAAAAPFGSTEEYKNPVLAFSNDIRVLENSDFDSFLAADNKMDLDLDLHESEEPYHAPEEFSSASAPIPPPRATEPTNPSAKRGVADAKATKTPEELLHYLISLQTFEGSWELTAALVSSLQIQESLVSREISGGINRKHLATAIVIAVFEEKLSSFKGSWELVVDKAREWLESEVGDVEKVIERARTVMV